MNFMAEYSKALAAALFGKRRTTPRDVRYGGTAEAQSGIAPPARERMPQR
ncbi:hypothetical protein [Actinomadura hibisca]|nr:hypothetical protein [Actinomadura hibisca]